MLHIGIPPKLPNRVTLVCCIFFRNYRNVAVFALSCQERGDSMVGVLSLNVEKVCAIILCNIDSLTVIHCI